MKLSLSDSQDGTILIVDDNQTNLGVLADFLEESGFTILIARDGESGLEKARYGRPDLILLDVMMPGIDGFETCRRLKADQATQDIPVIFVTALSNSEEKIKGFEVGAVDYITKPLHEKEVLARVTTHLRLQALTHQLQQEIAERKRTELELQRSLKEVQDIRFGRGGWESFTILDSPIYRNGTVCWESKVSGCGRAISQEISGGKWFASAGKVCPALKIITTPTDKGFAAWAAHGPCALVCAFRGKGRPQ
jgi:CheY-like chemotaxis protein